MTVRLRHLAMLALSLTAIAACFSDHASTAPPRFDGSELRVSADKQSFKVKTKVKPVHRDKGLGSAVSATQTIGPAGGLIVLPGAGAVLAVPAGALATPVSITMTALPGDAIAYEFAPHGLVFLKPATLAQQLGETKEKGEKGATTSDPVELGYFSLPSQVGSLVAELEDVRGGTEIDGVFTAQIWHFSGYAVGCGRR